METVTCFGGEKNFFKTTCFDIFSKGKFCPNEEENVKISLMAGLVLTKISVGGTDMWNNRQQMAKQIKSKQREMYRLAKTKGVSDPDVLSKSCEIDDLIVEYMKKYGNVNTGTLFPYMTK